MSGFAVQPAVLHAARARVTEAVELGRAELARVHAAGDDLLGYGWSGVAAAAFRTGFDEWLAAARTMLAALDDQAGALGAAAVDYERAEVVNRAGLARLAS